MLRFFVKVSGVTIVILLTAVSITPINAQNTGKVASGKNQKSLPNIILIMADDLGYETLECNGGTSYHTPMLNKMAQEGMRFENAYATPLCTPTRVQLMTGKYNFRNYKRFGFLDPKEKTFAHMLKRAGYKTAIAGKWQLDGGIDAPGIFGFDEYCMWQLQQGDFWGRYKNPVIYSNGRKLDDTEGKYGPDVFSGFVLSAIENYHKQGQPFFIYYPMALVHDPFQPTPDDPEFKEYKIKGLNDTTYFKSMMCYTDKIVGRILNKVTEMGIDDNTLIIFTGDNGTSRAVYSRMGDKIIRGDKGFTIKAGTHVPLLVKWPGKIKPGSVNHNLIDFTDFFPTLADVAGRKLSDESSTDGKSFYRQLLGKNVKAREWVFCDYNGTDKGFYARRYAQDKTWKLYSNGEFYNFITDPEEKNPIEGSSLCPAAFDVKKKLQRVLNEMN